MTAPPGRPDLSITEAARAARVDRRTIRRRLDADEFPGAYRQDDPRHGPGQGPWRIPVPDLIAAGLQLHAPTAPETPEVPAVDVTELAELRRRAEVAEAKLAGAEALAEERSRTIESLERALAVIEAAARPGELTASTPTTMPAAAAPPVEPITRRARRWWQR